MSMQPEWKDRLKMWKDELKNHIFKPVGSIEFSGFETSKHLTYEEAKEQPRRIYKTGESYGQPFGYAWFFAHVKIPKECNSEIVTIDINLGGEGLLYLNGEEVGTKRADWIRYKYQSISDLILSESATEGDIYEIAFECYCGHGVRDIVAGPIFDENKFLESKKYIQPLIGGTTFGIWNENSYQLLLDVSMLIDIRNCLDENSLRTMEIDNSLKKFTTTVDYENGKDCLNESISLARKMLKPLMDCKNGTTSPKMYMFGHSHLDIAWLWTIDETTRKCARTFSTQLKLMDKYDNYKFLQSQPYIYELTKKHYPNLYLKIKEKVKNGQFIPEGGMWVEADTNITSGESLVRQFIYGINFFKEEFNYTCKLLWLPDVFGYSAALPQIMKGVGIKYFSTQKILSPYNESDRFPYNYFEWKGIDGSRVTSFIHQDYTAPTTAKAVINRFNNRVSKDNLDSFLYPFGYGDGGGGATRDHLENISRIKDLEGVPRSEIASPIDFFENLVDNKYEPDVYYGELYYQAHRGVYTSQAKTKLGNRRSEFALRELEVWNTLINSDWRNTVNKINVHWKTLLVNQFHDILPGSSIKAVHDRAENELNNIVADCNILTEKIINSPEKDYISVYNSLSWDRYIIVELPNNFISAVDENNNKLPIQNINSKLFTRIFVKQFSSTSIYDDRDNTYDSPKKLNNNYILENDYLKVILNDYGEIVSVFDKEYNWEVTNGKCNVFRMYNDVPRIFDAWDIDVMYEESEVQLDNKAELTFVSEGALCSVIKVEKNIKGNKLVQFITLFKHSREIRFHNSIDWNQTHKLLKVDFELNINSNDMINEIQYGYLTRPTHKSRQYDKDRYEVCNQKWSALVEANKGVGILNDCKYGISGDNNRLSLSLLKSGKAPDYVADCGIQEFTYSMYIFNENFYNSDLINKSYELNTKPLTSLGKSNYDSFISIDNKNIIIDCVKTAEDLSGDIIIRIYESKNASSSCKIKFNFEKEIKNVNITNMLEEDIKDINVENNSISVHIKAFEIQTYRIRLLEV